MSNLSKESTTKMKEFLFYFVIFLGVLSFPLRSPDWPAPPFGVIYGVKNFFAEVFFLFEKKNCYYFSKLQGFSWCLEIENKNAIIFRLSCPEDGIIDRISRSSGGRVWDQHTHTE